jgi:hypothetical protein
LVGKGVAAHNPPLITLLIPAQISCRNEGHPLVS